MKKFKEILEESVLSASKRKKLKKKTFGLPGRRAYPMPDRSHAANAKARARQMLDKGKLSKSAYDRIISKANSMLGEGVIDASHAFAQPHNVLVSPHPKQQVHPDYIKKTIEKHGGEFVGSHSMGYEANFPSKHHVERFKKEVEPNNIKIGHWDGHRGYNF